MDLSYFNEELDGEIRLKTRTISHKTLSDIEVIISDNRPQHAVETHAELFAQSEQWRWYDKYQEYLAVVDATNEYNNNLPVVGYDENDQALFAEPKGIPLAPIRPVHKNGADVLNSIGYYVDKFKAERIVNVKAITVVVEGMKFDGDETSQNRMARTILGMQTSGILTTKWKLADNTSADVSVEQLAAAMLLAGQKQTDLWGMDDNT